MLLAPLASLGTPAPLRTLTPMDLDGPTASFGPGGHTPPPTPQPPGHSLDLAQGDVVGSFRIFRFIGEGAFGTVFEAETITEPFSDADHPSPEQADPPSTTSREMLPDRVALKLIKPGMDTKAVLERFEAERIALQRMNHPGVARVYTGGVTSPQQGHRPYFAMELVRGHPIKQVADTLHHSIHERCQLFIKVCEAVQHAHSKGIVHRDLKPSNILVATDAAGVPQPKVIDFGVAKAIHQKLTDYTLVTAPGQLMGTPEYMSPEQADMSGPPIDARADVYALGVILYELVTGDLPFDKSLLRAQGLTGLKDLLTTQSPPTPSVRFSKTKTSRATYQDLLTTRRLTHKAVRKHLNSRLDAVIMQCLQPDPTRRYPSPSAIAEDLDRYLRNKPVKARPPMSRSGANASSTGSLRGKPKADRTRGAITPLDIVAPIITLLLLGVATFFIARQLGFNFGSLPTISTQRPEAEPDFLLPRSLEDLPDPAPASARAPTEAEPPAATAATITQFNAWRAELERLLDVPTIKTSVEFSRARLAATGYVLNEAERREAISRCERFRKPHFPALDAITFTITANREAIETDLAEALRARGDTVSTVRAFSNRLYIRRDAKSPLSAEDLRAEARRYVFNDALVEIDP